MPECQSIRFVYPWKLAFDWTLNVLYFKFYTRSYCSNFSQLCSHQLSSQYYIQKTTIKWISHPKYFLNSAQKFKAFIFTEYSSIDVFKEDKRRRYFVIINSFSFFKFSVYVKSIFTLNLCFLGNYSHPIQIYETSSNNLNNTVIRFHNTFSP